MTKQEITEILPMGLTQMAAHIRKRVKYEGIKARVRVAPGGGFIQVFPVTYDAVFSEADQRTIRHIAQCNRLTKPRGEPIDLERMTDFHGASFWLP